MIHQELNNHDFVKSVLASIPILLKRKSSKELEDGSLDEYEFYLIRVAKNTSLLLGGCTQLENAILFMSNFHQTESLKKQGITRVDHLRYSVENYIIRTQTIYDLMLKLIDAVFHLANDDAQCKSYVILENIKVRNSHIPKLLKPLSNELRAFKNDHHTVVPFKIDRNNIIHHGRHFDSKLERIEKLNVLEQHYHLAGESLPPELSPLPELKKQDIQEFIKEKKDEYSKLNTKIFKSILNIFDSLQVYFEREKEKLQLIYKIPPP